MLLLEADGEVVGDVAVAPERLPRRGRRPDAVLTVVVEDGELTEARYRAEESRERKETAQSRFDRLAERPPRRSDRESESESEGESGDEDGDDPTAR